MSWYVVKLSGIALPVYAYFQNENIITKLYFIEGTSTLTKDRAMNILCRRYKYRLNEIRISTNNAYFLPFIRYFHHQTTLGVIDFIFDNEPSMEELTMINLYPSYTLTMKNMGWDIVSKALTLPLLGLHYLRVYEHPKQWNGPYMHLLIHLSSQTRGFNPLNHAINRLIVYFQTKTEANRVQTLLQDEYEIFNIQVWYLRRFFTNTKMEHGEYQRDVEPLKDYQRQSGIINVSINETNDNGMN